MNDYNFVEKLENKLEGASVSNIKDLLSAFEFSFEEQCKILNPSTANLAFFEHLSKCRPNLTLRDLRNDVENEKISSHSNMSLFSKIDEDILKGSVSIKLDSTLGKLSEVPNDWQYILERVAGNLIPAKGMMLPSWENVASAHGYSTDDINDFKRQNKDHDESPLQKVLSLLCAREHAPTVSLFVDKLRRIKREDVASMVEEWQSNRIVSIVISLEMPRARLFI